MSDPDSPYTGPVADARTSRPAYTYVTSRTRTAARVGVTMGTALAITISWSENHSILWAIVHGFLSWLYVIYYALTR